MIRNSLRGLSVALVLGTATVAVASLATVGVAQADGVRPAVGKPLQEAVSLAKAGKGSAALAKVRQAEGVGNLTSAERKVIAQTKQYVQVSTGNFSGGVTNSTTAKAKFAADYRAGRYHDVVSTDADLLKKFGAYDFQSQLLVAQAYYQMRDYKTAVRLLKGLGSSEQVVKLKMAAAAKMGDNDAVREAAEGLVLKGQSQFWRYLLTAADNTHGLNDEETLGIYRVRLRTGQMRNQDDYSTATQLAILLGYPQEAVAIQQKGFDDKVLSGIRQQKLLAQAQKAAAEQVAQFGKLVKDAQAAKTGEPLIKLAEVYWGVGKFQEARRRGTGRHQEGRQGRRPRRSRSGHGLYRLEEHLQGRPCLRQGQVESAGEGDRAAVVGLRPQQVTPSRVCRNEKGRRHRRRPFFHVALISVRRRRCLRRSVPRRGPKAGRRAHLCPAARPRPCRGRVSPARNA